MEETRAMEVTRHLVGRVLSECPKTKSGGGIYLGFGRGEELEKFAAKTVSLMEQHQVFCPFDLGCEEHYAIAKSVALELIKTEVSRLGGKRRGFVSLSIENTQAAMKEFAVSITSALEEFGIFDAEKARRLHSVAYWIADARQAYQRTQPATAAPSV